MIVTAAELQSDFNKYLRLLRENEEDILIMDNGQTVAKLIKQEEKKGSAVDYLCGLLEGVAPVDIDRHKIREMRLSERYDTDNV